MRIHKLKITNYRGVEQLDTELAPSGALVSGANGRGKTTVLNAVRAALIARGVDAGDIRIGAERAEILVDLDAVSVKRVITPKASTVTVTNADGFAAKKPQTYLNDLVGGGAVDPVELFLADKKSRRKQILSALPVTVTIEQLREWVPSIPANFDCSGHGLEVVERVRKLAYDQRTAANAAAKKAREDADRARDDAAAAAKGLPAEAPSVANATAATDRAKGHLADLEARRNAVASAAARTEGARAKVASLRADADGISVPLIDEDRATEATAAWQAAADRVAQLRAELVEAERIEKIAAATLNDIANVRERARVAQKRVDDLHAQAAMLEETIGAATPVGPTDDEIAVAKLAVEQAITAGAIALRAEEASKLAERATELVAKADAAEREAARLDGIVKVLTNDAPTKLLADANAIPGLSIDGDDVLLDGKSLDALCGAEQLRFAVQIAKRAAGKVRVLLVDGVERLDPDQYEAFVHEATADNFQVLCTRVDRGDVHIEAIERDVAEAAE